MHGATPPASAALLPASQATQPHVARWRRSRLGYPIPGPNQVAARLLLSGDLLSGTDAAAAGLVAASLPDGEAAMAEALALARRVAMQSPLAVRATLRTLRQRADADLARALLREADAQAQSYASADYAEGLAAVRAKRTPSFEGA